jgi:hypothetical protein
MECYDCNRTAEDTSLFKCPICFRYFCLDHAYVMSGQRFCTQLCAQYFFFSDEQEDEG